MACSVELKNVDKSFFTLRGRVDVMRGISLHIEPRELFVLLGPSGCGKSTLLNMIAGLEKPTAGSITIGDAVVADPGRGVFIDPFRRNVAMVFQSYALYPHMTVRANIAFPLTNLKPRPPAGDIGRKVREAARLLRIEELLDRKPAELSGGQRQRVAIGRAVVREPKVFLMDEPLSNLDAQLRTEMRAQLKELQRRLGITTVYVTHDQMEAMTLGDRIAVLNEGVIQQLGTPAGVYAHPSNVFVARFVGSPPMNLFEGAVKRDENTRVVLRTADGDILLPERLGADLVAQGKERCILGIRPEHIEPVAAGQGNFDSRISVVENVGSEYLASLFLKSGHIVVRAQHEPQPGPAGLRFASDRLHVFDAGARSSVE
ncbi:MAG: ATP-binding cassette domain-containing protein [Chitinivibrionales bacterium]|nr:ATP-binding cassette domain-containing protein [Chitinivibrionales bacterium]MBD3397442.1 ATP-binding cassette domain-containing protein [Chitinivibrionales bacterium]